MKREIYEVYAKVVDANGTYNTLSGYPVAFDSRNYDNDIEKTEQRAEGEWHKVCEAMCKNDTRQLQVAMMLRASDGNQMLCKVIGAIADVPDPNVEE